MLSLSLCLTSLKKLYNVFTCHDRPSTCRISCDGHAKHQDKDQLKTKTFLGHHH